MLNHSDLNLMGKKVIETSSSVVFQSRSLNWVHFLCQWRIKRQEKSQAHPVNRKDILNTANRSRQNQQVKIGIYGGEDTQACIRLSQKWGGRRGGVGFGKPKIKSLFQGWGFRCLKSFPPLSYSRVGWFEERQVCWLAHSCCVTCLGLTSVHRGLLSREK